jgi:bifunctional polynucleotide phosphatase/kinase
VSTVVIGFKTQKPDTSLFRSAYPTVGTGSFYVGDAAGRPGDWSDKDAQFAANLGVPFKTPESMFPLAASEVRPSLASKGPEVVIMVGYPASGKSTVARSLAGYHIVDGDRLKTEVAMVRDAKAHLGPVVFDCTGGSKKKRAAFVRFAKDNGLPVRVFWLQTSIEDSMGTE